MGRVDPPNLAGIHVLVVDDHEDSRYICEHALRHCGALVTTANSARQALGFCATLRPDVVVTDLSMPDEDGIWLAEQLHVQNERLPIIALSGFVDVFDDRLKGARFRQIFEKPADPWQLAQAIGALVQ